MDLDSVDLDARIAAADRGELAPAVAPGSGDASLADATVNVSPEALADAVEAGLWVGAFVQWREFACALLPEKCAVKLDEARAAKIGAAFARAAKHHNWKFAAIFSNPWGGVAAECFPVAQPVVMPMLKKMLEKKPAPAPAEAPAADGAQATPG